MRKLLIFSSLVVLLGVSSCIKEKQTGADLVVGDVVPDFTAVMSDGSEVTGAQLREGVSCIVFFTTSCPDCRQVLPHMQRLRNEYQPQGVRFAFISRAEGAESIREYWIANGYNIPFSAQTDRDIYELFAASRVPRIYICRDGLIKSIFTDSPTLSYEELAAAIDICSL